MGADSTLTEKSFLTVFQQHAERYPMMELDDFYKLTHQAHFGPGHLVPSAEIAIQSLYNEAATMGNGPPEPMFDPISPDARVVRVHLRPYLQEGGTLEQLGDSFLRTANGFKGSSDAFLRAWGLVVALATKGLIPFAPEAAARIGVTARDNDFPALRHSIGFNAAYKPAYRVISSEFWP